MNKNYKRFIVFFLISFILLITQVVAAAGNQLDYIDILVELDDYGNAKIRERWNLYYPNATENYIVVGNLGKARLENFQVATEDFGVFKSLDSWDIKASRDAKMYKSGIVTTSNGYELCWGIGDGKGLKTYIVTYDIKNMVEKYNDGITGFNWQFVADSLNPSPKEVIVTITRPGGFDPDETKIWAFGFTGEINNINRDIVSRTSQSFNEDSYMTIMVQTPSGYFSTTNESGKSSDQVRDLAFKGSDYGEKSSGSNLFKNVSSFIVVVFIIVFFWPMIIIPLVLISTKNKSTIVGMPNKKEDIPYSRELPYNDNLLLGYYLFSKYKNKDLIEGLISAYLLKWTMKGYLVLTNQLSILDLQDLEGNLKKSKTLDKKNKIELKLVSQTVPKEISGFEAFLFNTFIKIGLTRTFKLSIFSSKNKRQLDEDFDESIINIEKINYWARMNLEEFNKIITVANSEAELILKSKGHMEKEDKKFFAKTYFTDLGMIQVRKLIGFFNFLNDFTIIDEREFSDVTLWEEYLIWASVFGIADEVERQLRIVNPQYFETYHPEYQASRLVTSNLSRSGVQSYNSARSSGSGGSSSSGGGGGSSGGGSGGGAR